MNKINSMNRIELAVQLNIKQPYQKPVIDKLLVLSEVLGAATLVSESNSGYYNS